MNEGEASKVSQPELGEAREMPESLGAAIHERFKPFGGVDLDLPPRGPMRELPRFEGVRDDVNKSSAPDIMALIANAPWREAVTYRETWPHEYVMVKRDGQEELLAAFWARIESGEGVECTFFGQRREYLFLGEHKYWTMTECKDIALDADDYVLNRALLYRDRRDFEIRPGDRGV